ncbi:MAG: cell division protein FtsZ, partial [Microgenomates group bacterium]
SEAAEMISTHADPDANIIFGATIDEAMGDQIKISVIATGFDSNRGSFAGLQGLGQSSTQFTPKNDDKSDDDDDTPFVPPKPSTKDDSSDPFDIPAFLRQQ